MNASVDEVVTAVLAEVDAAIDEVSETRDSLHPDRDRATSCVELGRRCLESADADIAAAFARGLRDIGLAIVECFPENIFWDLDYLAAVLCAQESVADVEKMAARVVALQRGFGRGTEIRFRYAHDFLFGFDWARWVGKDPDSRQHIGPFDPEFLTYLERRHGELLDLIAADDDKYPALNGDEPRNPFKFAREPDAERTLHEALAADDLIPVRVWEAEGRRVWDRDFTKLREEYAQRLKLPVRR